MSMAIIRGLDLSKAVMRTRAGRGLHAAASTTSASGAESKFRVAEVKYEAFPDSGGLSRALEPLKLSTTIVADAVAAFESRTPIRLDEGYQVAVAGELAVHVQRVLCDKAGLMPASRSIPPNYSVDVALGRDDARLFLGEIEFRPNFEKDLVKFMIAQRADRLAAALLAVPLSRAINPRYTSMPTYGQVLNVLHKLSPNFPLIVVGFEGKFESTL
jgi:hypothetical protein